MRMWMDEGKMGIAPCKFRVCYAILYISGWPHILLVTLRCHGGTEIVQIHIVCSVYFHVVSDCLMAKMECPVGVGIAFACIKRS